MKWLKVGAVVFAAVTITALGIDASDTLTGRSGTLLGQLIATDVGVCPAGMVEVQQASSFTCVDKYEASTHKDCPNDDPKNEFESKDNIETKGCQADSKADAIPWRYVTREQAQVACAQSGKRLPSSNEWYQAAIGTVDDAQTCNIESDSVLSASSNSLCISAAGAENMIGNVWEWVSDDVIDGQYNSRSLPEEGYITQVDSGGLAVTSSDKASPLFNNDYIWASSEGFYGILRGGFYGSESDAGLYSVHAKTPPTTAGTAIGFRCVR